MNSEGKTNLKIKSEGAELSDQFPILNLNLTQPKIADGDCNINGSVTIDNE